MLLTIGESRPLTLTSIVLRHFMMKPATALRLEKYLPQKSQWNSIPLTIDLLKELGFVVPKRPLPRQEGPVIFYKPIKRILVRKWLGIFPITCSCRPFFFTISNNQVYYIVYTPLPRTIHTLQELYDYICY